ncbi:hypothetical protein [Streptomyces sp. NPDC057287]|uniref:hypothetical protein n=1 Tax=Streptomyces sp. NPDC057287 TaxID=3346086 RepID=UPI00362E94D1
MTARTEFSAMPWSVSTAERQVLAFATARCLRGASLRRPVVMSSAVSRFGP